jgi:hypothetical protein
MSLARRKVCILSLCENERRDFYINHLNGVMTIIMYEEEREHNSMSKIVKPEK